MPPSKPRVLLTDLKNVNITAEIPFLFYKAGVSFDVYCSEKSWLLKSRYRQTWHRAETDNIESYAKSLSHLVASGEYDWVVFLDDFSLRAAHDFLDENLARKILPVVDFSYKELTCSKVALSVLSKQHNISTPRFAVHKEGNNIVNDSEGVPFPLLLKIDRSGGGKGIRFCTNESELTRAYESIPVERRDNLLIQEYISGDNISCEALYHNGTIITHATARVLQNTGNEFSVSCVREYYPDESLKKELIRIGKVLGFNSFCSFTFIYDKKTLTYYMVEADLRTHVWFSLSRFAGVDFSDAIRHRILGTPFTQHPQTMVVRHFSRDISRSVMQRDFKNLLDWIMNKDNRWRFIPTHDMHLFFSTITSTLRIILFSYSPLRPIGSKIFKHWKKFYRGASVREAH